MRKVFKVKRHSCDLCKMHKRGWKNRWKPQQFILLREAEREMREAER